MRGPANLYRAESPEKASAWIAGLPPAQRRSIDDIERSLTNDRLEKQAQALESRGQLGAGGGSSASAPGAGSGQRLDNLPSGAGSGQRWRTPGRPTR
ncbi:hypothetical protein IE978_09835 [Klebsiella pneumoniae]|uniref:Uncharacterized protein n=1 Tax=Klebsiella pneumoniae TaxID=573 RepID=A0A927E127_KLEPN|nr:hypothetical protein [Klebsiella pneumoniae]